MSEMKRHPNQYPAIHTRTQQALFLKALAQCGTVKGACQQANIASIALIYQWASASTRFSQRFDEAREKGQKNLLLRYEEYMDSVLLPETPMPIEDFSRTQISRMFRMKRLDPRYRDNVAVNVQINGPQALVFEVPVSLQEQSVPHNQSE